MNLKERLPRRGNEGGRDAFVSALPTFDMERLDKINEMAYEWLTKRGLDGFLALSIAYKLALYNLFTSTSDSRSFDLLSDRFGSLANKEKAFSDPKNPFPTIGIEIEVPKKVVNPSDFSSYALFFDKVGMPRNRLNATGDHAILGTHWEFSPPPSYSSETQSRIIAELIRGGFLPSLRSSQKPEDIREYLDNKLVSLHVNLEILREFLTISLDDTCKTFSNMLALAFTSPERLMFRTSTAPILIKKGEQTVKSRAFRLLDVGRLELKAHEVRTGSTYRLLKEAQLLGGALFAFLYGGDPWLSQKWQEIKPKAESLIEKVFVGQPLPLGNEIKSLVAKRLEETTLQQELRSLITVTTAEIAKRYGV